MCVPYVFIATQIEGGNSKKTIFLNHFTLKLKEQCSGSVHLTNEANKRPTRPSPTKVKYEVRSPKFIWAPCGPAVLIG